MKTDNAKKDQAKPDKTEKFCYHPVLQASLTKGEIVCTVCGRTVYTGLGKKPEPSTEN